MQTAKQVLKDVRNIPNLKTWYAGAYESSTHSIDISLSPSNTPVALVLSSYGSIEWKINRNNVDLRAIIFSSLEEGASVSGVGDVPIYSMAYRDIPNLYKPLPDCYDAGGMFHCE